MILPVHQFIGDHTSNEYFWNDEFHSFLPLTSMKILWSWSVHWRSHFKWIFLRNSSIHFFHSLPWKSFELISSLEITLQMNISYHSSIHFFHSLPWKSFELISSLNWSHFKWIFLTIVPFISSTHFHENPLSWSVQWTDHTSNEYFLG